MASRRSRLSTDETGGHRCALIADPADALAAMGGVTYSWDLTSDRLDWGPNAGQVLNLPIDSLPTTGAAFRAMVEPIGGLLREEALEDPAGSYDLRYALRLAAGQAVSIQDAGGFSAPGSRSSVVRGFIRADPPPRSHDTLPRTIHDRTALLRRLEGDLAAASRTLGVAMLVCELPERDLPDQDEILHLIRSMMRPRDYAAALSGHRFALVLATCSPDDAANALKRLTGLLSGPNRPVRASLACAPRDASDACRLLQRAEHALSGAIVATPEAAEPFDYLVGLNERSLRLTLAPVMDAQDHQKAFLRARLAAGRGGQDIPLESPPCSDLALLVDARKLELATRFFAHSETERLIVPLEAATLRDREWLSVLAAHLGAHPGLASRLVLALPERILAEPAKVLGRLDAMKALGLSLALDGYGSGYATQARLKGLPFDLAIVDPVFIRTLSRSTGDRLYVRTLMEIAHRLGMATLAEGVGSEQNARMLSEWGMDYMTGPGILPGETRPLRLLRRA